MYLHWTKIKIILTIVKQTAQGEMHNRCDICMYYEIIFLQIVQTTVTHAPIFGNHAAWLLEN